MADPGQDAELAGWCGQLAEALAVQGFTVDVDLLLGVAGTAAHAVRRPAAPLTTYVVGFVAGRAAANGEDPAAAARAAVTAIETLAAEYPADGLAEKPAPLA